MAAAWLHEALNYDDRSIYFPFPICCVWHGFLGIFLVSRVRVDGNILLISTALRLDGDSINSFAFHIKRLEYLQYNLPESMLIYIEMRFSQ